MSLLEANREPRLTSAKLSYAVMRTSAVPELLDGDGAVGAAATVAGGAAHGVRARPLLNPLHCTAPFAATEVPEQFFGVLGLSNIQVHAKARAGGQEPWTAR